MKQKKDFDCAEMKAEIQRRIREASAGLTEEEARRTQWAKVLSDPAWRAFLAAAPVYREKVSK